MRRDVQEIFRNTPHSKQVMMFSATLSKEIRPVCKKFMQDVSRQPILLTYKNYHSKLFSTPHNSRCCCCHNKSTKNIWSSTTTTATINTAWGYQMGGDSFQLSNENRQVAVNM